MLSNSKVPKCVVLMASYNGIPFISEQIDSILSQAEVDVRLFVRDDGSSDGTRDLLQRYADEGSRDANHSEMLLCQAEALCRLGQSDFVNRRKPRTCFRVFDVVAECSRS